MTPQEMVTEFHRVFRHPIGERPEWPQKGRVPLRVDLIQEEVDELLEACEGRDIVGVADALADLIYVTYGMALEFGINLDEVIAEVHRSNLTKLFTLHEAAEAVLPEGGYFLSVPAPGDRKAAMVGYRADGKVLKGPRFEEPRIYDALAWQKRVSSDGSS